PVVREAQPLALEYACRHEAEGRPWVGLYAARHIGKLLELVGESAGVRLSLAEPPATATELSEALKVDELPGMTIWASRSRAPLLDAVGNLDETLYWIGGFALAGAMIVALLASRGLA